MKNKIIDTLKFIIGVITVILVVVFKDNLSTAGLVGGIGVALYGVCSFLLGDKLGYIFTSLGVSLVSALSIYKLDILEQFESVTFFICLAMALIVIFSLIFEYITDKNFKKIHSLEVEAEVIDLFKNPNTTKEFYQPIYAYRVGKQDLEVGAPGFYDKGLPKLGDKLKIYVNPNDNLDVYFEKKMADKLHFFAVGAFFLVASIVIIITLFV